MLIKYFKQYMKITRGITDKSVNHYITGVNSINALLERYDFPVRNIFAVSSEVELNAVKTFLETNEEFSEKDSIGHHMYSVAFNHFYRFACSDEVFFRKNITTMDIAITKPSRITTDATQWKRNQIVIAQAIAGAKHCCEYSYDHRTFIARSSGKAYMEGHHLIPLKSQPKFECSIDVYANVVCLCPNCHRLMHFGRDKERIYMAESFYEHRSERLAKSGLDISKKDFLDLVVV